MNVFTFDGVKPLHEVQALQKIRPHASESRLTERLHVLPEPLEIRPATDEEYHHSLRPLASCSKTVVKKSTSKKCRKRTKVRKSTSIGSLKAPKEFIVEGLTQESADYARKCLKESSNASYKSVARSLQEFVKGNPGPLDLRRCPLWEVLSGGSDMSWVPPECVC